MSSFWGPFFKVFMGIFFFFKYCRVRTEKLHRIKVNKSQKKIKIGKYFLQGKFFFFKAKNLSVSTKTLWLVLCLLLLWMPTKNDVFFTTCSWEKDIIFGESPKQIFGPSYFVRALIEIAHRKTYVQSFFVYFVTYFSMVSCSWERVKAPTPAMVKCSKAGKNVKKRVIFSRFRKFKKRQKSSELEKICPKLNVS